jgi:dsRNA-specific ribonuclease
MTTIEHATSIYDWMVETRRHIHRNPELSFQEHETCAFICRELTSMGIEHKVVATTGVAHNQQFEVECSIPSLKVTLNGKGASRRAAEQAAAKLSLEAAQKIVSQSGRKPKKTKATKKKASLVTAKDPTDDQLNLKLKSE